MTINAKDAVAGAFFMAVGAYALFGALTGLSVGTALHMGPGYFPTMLGLFLLVVGAAIAIRAVGAEPSPIGAIPWRGIVLISLAPVLCGLLMRGLGMVPAVALASLVASLASPNSRLLVALAVAVGLTVFSVAVFHYGIGLPIPMFGHWLRGFGG